MPKQHGNVVANYIVQREVHVPSARWVPLFSAGSANMPNRAWMEVATKGVVGNVVYFYFRNAGEAAPAVNILVKGKIWVRGTGSRILPVSDKVTVYARMDNKAGATENGVNVVVAEYR